MKDSKIKLFDALVKIRDMPEHDQDDGHGLRNIASEAVNEYLATEVTPHGKNKQILSQMKIGETRNVGKVPSQHFLQAARRLGITITTKVTADGLWIRRVE